MGDGAGKDSIITEYKPLEQGKALVVRKTVSVCTVHAFFCMHSTIVVSHVAHYVQ